MVGPYLREDPRSVDMYIYIYICTHVFAVCLWYMYMLIDIDICTYIVLRIVAFYWRDRSAVRATKERLTGVLPSSNMAGEVDMWGRLCPVPMCLPRRSDSRVRESSPLALAHRPLWLRREL